MLPFFFSIKENPSANSLAWKYLAHSSLHSPKLRKRWGKYHWDSNNKPTLRINTGHWMNMIFIEKRKGNFYWLGLTFFTNKFRNCSEFDHLMCLWVTFEADVWMKLKSTEYNSLTLTRVFAMYSLERESVDCRWKVTIWKRINGTST